MMHGMMIWNGRIEIDVICMILKLRVFFFRWFRRNKSFVLDEKE